jgi:hypothetical protein
MKSLPSNYSDIVAAISSWPVGSRIMLAQVILSRLAKEMHPSSIGERNPVREVQDGITGATSARRALFDEAWGMLRTEAPPPTDEEVEKLLEDARIEKYG